MKRQRQARPAKPQQAHRDADGVRAPGQIGIPQSPYLTLAEGALLWRFDAAVNPKDAFRRWLHRHAIPIRKVGKRVLVDRRLVEAVLGRDGADQLVTVR